MDDGIIASEDRRQDCRADVPVYLWIEVPLAFSYEPVELDAAGFSQWQWEELAVPPDLVKAMVDENDLTIRDPLLLQMVTLPVVYQESCIWLTRLQEIPLL